MMATKDKSQDEKNLKTLRELAALPANRHCFDCQQRGPTYINVTVGSFVCTSCSGMLRGLNPPHRVKSITMASFTAEEMDQIRSKGNEYCRQVWLGKYDPSQSLESEYQNLQKIKDFMIQKYEDKKYYVDPEFAVKKPKPRAPAVPTNNANNVHTSRSQTSIMETSSQLMQKTSWPSQDFPCGDNSSKESDLFGSGSHDPFRQNTCQAAFRGCAKIDELLEQLYLETAMRREKILAAYYGMSYCPEIPIRQEKAVSSARHQAYTPAESSSFADFGSAFGKATNASGQFESSISVSTSAFSTAQHSATSTTSTLAAANKPSQKKPAPPPPDRYAALADLDNQLHQQQHQTLITSAAPPPSNVTSFWTGNSVPFGPVNYDSAVPNPFGHGMTPWAVPQPGMVVAGNPFQSINAQAMTAKQVPVPFSNVANGVLNGNVADQQQPPPQQQNGTVSNNFWAQAPVNHQQQPTPWSSTAFLTKEQDPFSIKSAVPVDHCNPWAQTLVNESANPFANADKVTAIPPKNMTNNPFL